MLLAGGALVVALIALLITQFNRPERSVVAYCKAYREENAKLPHDGGDKYKAGIFRLSSNNLPITCKASPLPMAGSNG